MARHRLNVTEARGVLGYLGAATQAADPNLSAPIDWMKRFTTVVRSIAPREDQRRYRLDGFQGITMGQLHRHVAELQRDFDQLVDDNPRLTEPDPSAARS